MKLLFDQGAPRRYLLNHIAETAYEKGWNDISNGELLKLAEAEDFDALITTDQNLRYQQNLSGRKIAIAVLLTTSWPRIRKHVITITRIIDGSRPGSYVEIPIP
jgi:hypothetical protein